MLSFFDKPLAAEARSFDVNDYFESEDPQIMDFTDRVFRKRILNKVMPTEGYLHHN